MRKLGPLSSNLLISCALFAALLTLGACQSNKPAEQAASPDTTSATGPTHAMISNEFTTTSAVTAVDAKKRLVTLRREDGSLVQVKCGEDVKNFAQIGAGDTLHVQYMESLEATRRPAGETAEPATAVTTTMGAEPGSTPAGGAGVSISVTVKIESLDLEHDIVVFSLASGDLMARRLATPEGREFAKGLKIGDTVQLDYTEVVAMAIEKV
jgi:hypothetical protein